MSIDAQGQRLRIAYIVGAFPDVSETFVVNQVVGMAARGHCVDIYTTCPSTARVIPDAVERHGLLAHTHALAAPKRVRRVVDVLRLLVTEGWRKPFMIVRLLADLWRLGGTGWLRVVQGALTLVSLGACRYDVIHAQFGPLGVLASRLVQVGALRGAVVTSFRGYDVTKHLRAYPTAYDELFRRGVLFLPVSGTLAQGLIGAGCERGRIQVHRSGIACGRLRYRERRPRADEPVRLISVARLVEKKGIAYALHAVARVIGNGRRVSYTVVGEGPLRRVLEELIRDLGLGPHVQLVGAKAHGDVLHLVDNSHILIAPSVTAADGDAEGIPNSVKEAMAMGLPVIATRHAGIPELVEEGVSGFLVPERDAAALAERLIDLIDRPSTWSAIGQAGRRRIEAEYDIDRLNDELVGLYGAAVNRDMAAAQSSFSERAVVASSAASVRRT